MADKNSLRDVIRRYIDSEKLLDSIRSIGELVISDEFTRASFEKLLQTESLSFDTKLKESLLDMTLVVAHECVEDHYLSDVEIAELDNLVTIFRIEEGDFLALRKVAVQEIINAQAMWMLQDHYVTEQEEFLQRDLQRLFGLGYGEYVKLLHPLAIKHIDELENEKLATQDREKLKLIDVSIQNLRSVFLVSSNKKSKLNITFERPS